MFLEVDDTSIYYEISGTGQPIVFIHAGVADSRQWNNEFEYFAADNHVIRYDLRGFGKSKSTDSNYNDLHDLTMLLDHLNLDQTMIMIGCSMGGGLALDYAIENPNRVAALILVCSAPSDLRLDIPAPEKFKLVAAAEKAGDLDLVAELETQIWFDGGRDTNTVDQDMRRLAYDMNRLALSLDETSSGERLPNREGGSVGRLKELTIPIMAIIGAYDIPYMHAAFDFMVKAQPDLQAVTIGDAAHLPNMDQPLEFRRVVSEFIQDIRVG